MAKTEDQVFDDLFSVLDDYNPYSTYLSQSPLCNVTDWIDTGSKMLNAVISGSMYKGIPKGRVTLLAGESGVGKSYIGLKIAGNAQKKGYRVVMVDTENAIDAQGARNLGCDPTKIKYFPAKSIEQVRNALFALLEKIEQTHTEGKVLVIIDSIANILSEMEVKRMGKDSASADMGTFAKSIKSLIKMCTIYGGLTQTTFVMTNHIYDNPNEMYPDLVKCMAGGKACRYLPSVVLQLAKRNLKEKDSGEKDDAALGKGVAGIEMRCMCVKNRFIRPFVEGSLYLSWANGLDEEYGTLDLAIALGVLNRRGSVYDLYDGTSLGYAKNFRKNKQLWEEKIYPELEKRLEATWSYNNSIEEEVPEEILIADEDEVNGKPVIHKGDKDEEQEAEKELNDAFNSGDFKNKITYNLN